MKRFTETQKWSDPWFRKLSLHAKALWSWLCDNCDPAGVIDPDLELASFQIGYPYPLDALLEFGDRLLKLECGKWLVVKFIKFQYGDRLSRDCKAHNPVFTSLERHLITSEMIGYGKGMDTPQAKVKVKVTAKVKATDRTLEDETEIYSPGSRAALYYLNEKSGRHYRETASSLEPINARLKEKGVDIKGVKRMIDRQCAKWKSTDMADYLRPETLFGKQKFDGYYAAKDLPIPEQKTQPEQHKPMSKMTSAEMLSEAMR
jgi:uncharacterized phage protein (TIGR02220 family)